MDSLTSAVSSRVTLQLDWKAYFYKFVEVHGEPVHKDRRLLFKDGWMYGDNYNYQGPEYPPPEDKKHLRDLQLIYWTLRRQQLEEELLPITSQMQGLEEWSQHRSLPLQVVTIFYGRHDVSGLPILKRSEPKDLDLTRFKTEEEKLRLLIDECKQELEKLRLRGAHK